MGNLNSTKTRVVPLMDTIKNSKNLINELFDLFQGVQKISDDDEILEICYGDKEKELCPKQELLEWCVNNPDKLLRPENFGSKNAETQQNRKELLSGLQAKKNEALELIRKNPAATSKWYIFEGYSQPDIYIETKNCIYIAEAKRTEPNLTTSTTWLKNRDQLIRHVDNVIDSPKKVFYFFIIDESKENTYDLSPYGKNFEYYAASLPHRDEFSVKKIMSSYCGYTTWQKIQKSFGINFPETVEE